MEATFTDTYEAMRWLLRSQEDAIRYALERGREWKVHSVEVGIQTEPRAFSTPTFHRFSVRLFAAPTQKARGVLNDLSEVDMRERIRSLLEIPEGHRFSFGKSMEKPGLWQLTYKTRHQWTAWDGEGNDT